MARIPLKGGAVKQVKASKVTSHLLEQRKGFIVLLLTLTILLFVITPVGCATLLAVLTEKGAAAAP